MHLNLRCSSAVGGMWACFSLAAVEYKINLLNILYTFSKDEDILIVFYQWFHMYVSTVQAVFCFIFCDLKIIRQNLMEYGKDFSLFNVTLFGKNI